MNKYLMIGLLCCSFSLQGTLNQAYGVIKPSKSMPAMGILRFKESDGLELEGYFSRLEKGTAVVVSAWSLEENQGASFCAGPQCQAAKNHSYPVKELFHLGETQSDDHGYGEISLKLKGLTLEQLNDPKIKVLVYQKDSKSKKISDNLEGQNFSMVELRWIED